MTHQFHAIPSYFVTFVLVLCVGCDQLNSYWVGFEVCFSEMAQRHSPYAAQYHGSSLGMRRYDLSVEISDLHRLIAAPYRRSRHPFFISSNSLSALRRKECLRRGVSELMCLGPDAGLSDSARPCKTGRSANRTAKCTNGVCTDCCCEYLNGCSALSHRSAMNKLAASH